MAADFSFDITSEIDRQELNNALDQARKEIATRYDFKGVAVDIKLDEDKLTLTVPDEYKFKAVVDIIQSKLLRRGLDLRILGEQKQESASGGNLRVIIQLASGINQDQAKQINKIIREQMPKTKTVIQGDTIRVSSKNKDELQAVMRLLRDSSAFNIPLQFTNYR